jgi:hypothetical protein
VRVCVQRQVGGTGSSFIIAQQSWNELVAAALRLKLFVALVRAAD